MRAWTSRGTNVRGARIHPMRSPPQSDFAAEPTTIADES